MPKGVFLTGVAVPKGVLLTGVAAAPKGVLLTGVVVRKGVLLTGVAAVPEGGQRSVRACHEVATADNHRAHEVGRTHTRTHTRMHTHTKARARTPSNSRLAEASTQCPKLFSMNWWPRSGGLRVPPPTQSSLWQHVSGFSGTYADLTCVCRHFFPFPYGQFIIVVLVVITYDFPILDQQSVVIYNTARMILYAISNKFESNDRVSPK